MESRRGPAGRPEGGLDRVRGALVRTCRQADGGGKMTRVEKLSGPSAFGDTSWTGFTGFSDPIESCESCKSCVEKLSAASRRFCQGLAKPLHAVCQSLAILALVCQTLALRVGQVLRPHLTTRAGKPRKESGAGMNPAMVSNRPGLRIRGLRALRPRAVALPVRRKALPPGKRKEER